MTECKEESQTEAQLLELLEDIIIYEIAKRLVNYAGYVRFHSTCKSLQYMLPKTPSHQLNQVPCILLPHNNDHSGRRRSLFNLSENMMYNLDIPKIQNKLLRGSSHSWLLAVDGFLKLCLINPFTKAHIRLQPLDTFPDVLEYHPNMVDEEYLTWRAIDVPIIELRNIAYLRCSFICKVVLSSSPTSNGKYLAMAIHGEFKDLAFCRSGDKKWTHCQKDDPKISNIHFDIMFYEGKSYVLSGCGEIWIGDGASLLKMTRLAPSPPRRPNSDRCWLVRMTSGWRGNCIYFMDDYIDEQQEGIIGGYDNDVYKLENKRVESLPGFVFDSLLVWPQPGNLGHSDSLGLIGTR